MIKKRKRNYHMELVPVRGEGAARVWRCEYCKQEGGILAMQKGNCPHVYEPCKHCGGSDDSNECRPDCSGIAAILADPSVYVVGDPKDDAS